jgi:hypothetical protein
MKRRLQVIAIYCTALLALRLMAQDTGGGAGGAGAGGGDSSGTPGSVVTPDNSGDSGGMNGTGNGDQGTVAPVPGEGNSTNGDGTVTPSNNGENGLPQGGANQGQGGNGTGGLMGPNGIIPASGNDSGNGSGNNDIQGMEVPPPEGGGPPLPGSIIVPPGQEGQPGSVSPVPGTTPAPTPAEGVSVGGVGQGGSKTPPVSFSLPGGYGGSAPQTFTLGQGRFSKPPITFSFSLSQGYDDNVFNSPNHPEPVPTPEPTPPLIGHRVTGFIIGLPFTIVPITQSFTINARATPTPIQAQGKIGSAVTTATLAAQMQMGNPRTVFTADASLGTLDYWNRPGGKEDYDGNFDLAMVHRITPRMNLTADANFVYQKTPDIALVNAPTNNSNGNGGYLNGGLKVDLSYQWSSRVSTVTSYDMALNIQDGNSGDDLLGSTYGNQVRYQVSARNTVTADIRYNETSYFSNSAGDNTSVFYLVGLDSILSSRLRNTFSVGVQQQNYSGGGTSQSSPYLESATTLALPRGAELEWTNRVGDENSGAANEKENSYRTGLTLSQPISAKLVASVSADYNYIHDDDTTNSVGSFTQNQYQGSFSLGYTISARLSLNLSYSITDLESTQLNASYIRQQIFLGGTYSFR